MKQLLTIVFIFLASNSFAQQQKQDTSTFILKGKLADFEIMYKAVASPDDVTPNQKKEVLKFIEGIKPEKTDSTKEHKK